MHHCLSCMLYVHVQVCRLCILACTELSIAVALAFLLHDRDVFIVAKTRLLTGDIVARHAARLALFMAVVVRYVNLTAVGAFKCSRVVIMSGLS